MFYPSDKIVGKYLLAAYLTR